MTNTTQRGTVRAQRWAVRALTILGGAVAGTAAALLIGSASASAETASPVASETPATDVVVGEISKATDGLSALAGETAKATSQAGHELPASSGAEKAATEYASSLQHAIIVEPAQRTLGTLERVVRTPESAPEVLKQALAPSSEVADLGKNVWQMLNHDAAGLLKLPDFSGNADQNTSGNTDPAKAAPAAPAHDAVATVVRSHSTSPQVEVKTEERSDQTPSNNFPLPSSPGRAPMAPFVLPIVPSGATTGGHCDASLFSIPAGSMSFANSVATGVGRFGVRHTPLEPGHQPGVTPD